MAKPLDGFGFHWNELDGFRFESYSRSRFIPIYLALAFITVIVNPLYLLIELAGIDQAQTGFEYPDGSRRLFSYLTCFAIILDDVPVCWFKV
jgi:hypothetical protein